MTFYFAISPAVMATFPIDNGKALAAWRGEMVKNGTMAFVSVGVTNVLYSFLPFFNGINLFSNGFLSWIANQVLKLFMYIIAFSSAQDLISTISGWFGTGDAVKEGKATKKLVNDTLKKYSTKAMGVAGAFRGGWKDAEDHGGKRFLGALRGGFSQTGFSDAIKPYSDALKQGQDAGKEANKRALTTKGFLHREVDDDKLARYEAYDIIKAEKKEIDKQVDALNDERKAKLAQAQTQAERDKIDKEYNSMIQKLKANAGHTKALYTSEEKSIEHKKKANERNQGFLDKIDELANVSDQDVDFRKRIAAAAGLNVNDANIVSHWEDIKSGNFNWTQGVIADSVRDKMVEQYKLLASDITQNENAKKIALKNIKNLYNSGTKSADYLTKVLGGQITSDGDVTGRLELIRSKVDREQDAINKVSKKLKSEEAQLEAKRAADYGTQDPDKLKDIGENIKKK